MSGEPCLCASVKLLRKYTHVRALPPEVLMSVDMFLDQSHLWTLESATSAGLVGLLEPGLCIQLSILQFIQYFWHQ